VLGDLRAIDPAPERRLATAAHFLEGADGGWGRGAPFQSDGAVLHGSNGTTASLAGLESARDEAEREAAYRRIALLNALAIASGGLATTYMGDELGLLNDDAYRDDPERAHEGRWLHRPEMDWAALDGAAARRISGDLRALRAARVASGGAGAPALIDTGAPALLGVACGSDRVFLNFGAAPVALPSVGRDRLTGASCDFAPGWGVVWLEGER
jgi:amylosucrase